MNMEKFEKLKEETLSCKKCDLYKTRKNVVFGEGNINAKIMLIGEGPGYYEDIEGKVFIGKSGQLLDKILYACGFNRKEHIYISNIVKCHTPGNRNPTPEEREICIPSLYKQIELINPEIIVLLGATALKGLIDPNAKITQLRGKWIEWNGHLVMPTFHPSALLRNPKLKYDEWTDFKNIVSKYRELVNPGHEAPNC